MNDDKYVATGTWKKGLFPAYITWGWTLKALEDYVRKEQPWQALKWIVMDKNDNLKIYTTHFHIIQHSIQDILSILIDEPRIKYVVGLCSEHYNLSYFTEYLKNAGIVYNKEMSGDGKWKLFW